MSEQKEETKQLALIYVVERTGELMYAAHQINEKRPDWNGRVAALVQQGLETSLKAYRVGGVTSAQLAGLEGLISQINDILANKS